MKTLESRFENFVMDRTEDAGAIAINDREYQELSNKISFLMEEIKEHLPEGKKSLIGDLESYNSSQSALTEIYVYKQGLKDGIKFNDFLGR